MKLGIISKITAPADLNNGLISWDHLLRFLPLPFEANFHKEIPKTAKTRNASLATWVALCLIADKENRLFGKLIDK